MKKHGKIAAALACAFVFALGALPSGAAEGMKIGILDVKRCVTESKKGSRLADEFKSKMEETDRKIVKLEDEAEKISQEVERQQALMSEATKEEKRKRFLAIRDEVRVLKQNRKKAGDDMSDVILSDLQKIINGYAEEKGFDLILTTGGPWLAYAKKATDVTDDLIRLYDGANEKK